MTAGRSESTSRARDGSAQGEHGKALSEDAGYPAVGDRFDLAADQRRPAGVQSQPPGFRHGFFAVPAPVSLPGRRGFASENFPPQAMNSLWRMPAHAKETAERLPDRSGWNDQAVSCRKSLCHTSGFCAISPDCAKIRQSPAFIHSVFPADLLYFP